LNTPHANLLSAANAALVIVDLQEAFRGVIFEFERVAARTAIVVEAAGLLGLPVLATEQYPQKLGATVETVYRVLPQSAAVTSKTAFSACGAHPFVHALETTGRKQIILCGIESHVCMNQTAHDLIARGYQVHVPVDCTSSRTAENRKIGLDKMLRAGALPSSSEMALFELMRDAKHPHFKAISKLIK